MHRRQDLLVKLDESQDDEDRIAMFAQLVCTYKQLKLLPSLAFPCVLLTHSPSQATATSDCSSCRRGGDLVLSEGVEPHNHFGHIAVCMPTCLLQIFSVLVVCVCLMCSGVCVCVCVMCSGVCDSEGHVQTRANAETL